MAVTRARQIAFDTLRRVESESAYASDLLHAALHSGVSTVDAALATELTFGVLRWRRLLDFLLERRLDKPVEKLDLPVALALRLALYQIRFLGKIPARAAVNESVEMVKQARKSSAAALVNAVLRRLAEEPPSPVEKLLPPGLEAADRLGILHSHPTWLVARWLARFGEPQTIALLEADNRPPRLSCVVQDAAHRAEILGGLERAGLRIESGRLLKDAFAASGGSPAESAAFRAGKISIQDEASQAVPLLLGVKSGDRVLDLCAAPGGKTVALARAAGPGGSVVAADLHGHRLRAMAAQCKRLGLAGVRLIQLDATKPLPFAASPFEAILVDAPCSGTGTLARHPEIRWRLVPPQLAEFHGLQTKMLANALGHLAPGGRLVYSTCSVEPEENEDVVADALGNSSLPHGAASVRCVAAGEAARTLAPNLAPGISAAALFDAAGAFRTLPGSLDTDGFFAAVIART
jgi:16S rRNA (cytosine967-C5)-methyltransferase